MAKFKFGLDLGFGSVKIIGAGRSVVIPSQVVRVSSNAVNLSAFDNGRKQSKDNAARLIESNGQAYWVGLGAYAKNITAAPVEEYGIERLLNDSHIKMVVYSALSDTPALSRDEVALFVGLPFALASGDAAKSNIKRVKEWLVGEHTWNVDRRERGVNVVTVKALSQAMGAYCDYTLGNGGGQRNPVQPDALYGVLSVGFGTVEMAVISNDEIQDAEGFQSGVQSMLQAMRTNGESFSELDTKLRAGSLHLNGAATDWKANVRGKIDNKWRNLIPRFSKVICVGGGIRFMRDELVSKFGDKMWTPDTPDDEVTAVARGLYKLSESL